MDEIYEIDWNKCDYCKSSYYESDTGYEEFECKLTGYECMGSDIDSGCPLSFKYSIKTS